MRTSLQPARLARRRVQQGHGATHAQQGHSVPTTLEPLLATPVLVSPIPDEQRRIAGIKYVQLAHDYRALSTSLNRPGPCSPRGHSVTGIWETWVKTYTGSP